MLGNERFDNAEILREHQAATIKRLAGESVVLPLLPEFMRNEDGAEKQDCERNAAKR
jgi:hypothetical protein